jgi:hypothetical protein
LLRNERHASVGRRLRLRLGPARRRLDIPLLDRVQQELERALARRRDRAEDQPHAADVRA